MSRPDAEPAPGLLDGPAPSTEAVIGVTADGIIETCNPAAAELYGYAAAEIVGRSADILVDPRLQAAEASIVRAIIRRADVDGEPAGPYATTRLRKDGSPVPVSLTTSAVVDHEHRVVGATILSPGRRASPQARGASAPADEDRRGTAEADRNTLEAHLQQTQRMEMLGRLAGGVAHDFNNLLAVILNYAAFVAEELTDEAVSSPGWDERREVAQRDVEQIQEAARRATDLTHQLLAFARRDVIEPDVVVLNDAVTGVLDLLRRTLGEDMVLVTDLTDGLWPILADPGQLEQVLVNLAVNARDAMPSGGTLRLDTANIVVDAESVAGGSPATPGRHVRLRVSDTGSGMSAEVVTHAFEPFYTTRRDGGGTGLGLATVYGIVVNAGGTIAIQSEVGVGTTFTMMLPVTDVAAAAIVEPAVYERAPKGETVLVVEDEVALREVTARIFRRGGYRVLTAATGPDALALVAEHLGEIHLLVTDVVMPHMLGQELADRVRAHCPDVSVLYMSGYAEPVLASRRGGLDPEVMLIDKPFSEADLLATAAQVLDGRFPGFENVVVPSDPTGGVT